MSRRRWFAGLAVLVTSAVVALSISTSVARVFVEDPGLQRGGKGFGATATEPAERGADGQDRGGRGTGKGFGATAIEPAERGADGEDGDRGGKGGRAVPRPCRRPTSRSA